MRWAQLNTDTSIANLKQAKQRGFTIVALLIVIVVIAILAEISVVAFTGIQNRANDSAVQNDLRQFAQKLELYKAEHGTYPTPATADMPALKLSFTRGSYSTMGLNGSRINLIYCHPDGGASGMAIVAISSGGSAFQYSGGVSRYEGRTDNSSTDRWCQDAGAPISSAVDANRTIVRTASGWASWSS